MIQNKRGFFILICGVIMTLVRVIGEKFDNTDGDFILLLMAAFNIIALGIVILQMMNDMNSKIFSKMEAAYLSEKDKKINCRILDIINRIFWLLFFAFCFFYVLRLRSAVWNDVFTIFALSLSIASSRLVSEYYSDMYKIIEKISNLFKK